MLGFIHIRLPASVTSETLLSAAVEDGLQRKGTASSLIVEIPTEVDTCHKPAQVMGPMMLTYIFENRLFAC